MASRLEDGGHGDIEARAVRRLQRSVLSQPGLQPPADCVAETLDNLALKTILKWQREPRITNLLGQFNQNRHLLD